MKSFRHYLPLSMCCAILALPIPSLTYGLTKTMTWTPPTTNTDGTPVTLSGYVMYRSKDNGLTWSKIATINSTTTLYTDPNVPTGDICYEVTATNAMGEGARSNRACFSMPGAVPNAPTALQESGAVGSVTIRAQRKMR